MKDFSIQKNCVSRFVVQRAIGLGILACHIVGTISLLVNTIFQFIATLIIKPLSCCFERCKQWDKKLYPDLAVKMLGISLFWLCTNALLAWSMPETNRDVEECIANGLISPEMDTRIRQLYHPP